MRMRIFCMVGLVSAVVLCLPQAAQATPDGGPHVSQKPPQLQQPAPGHEATPFYAEQKLAVGGDKAFPNYRIPALAVTKAGTVLASYDGRPSAQDAPGPNSVLQRRSSDNGATWAPQETVRAGKATRPIEGYSDPSYVIDRETGSIFNFHVQSFDAGFVASVPGVDPKNRKVLHAEVSRSDDDGRTWTHRTITPDITPDPSTRSRFAASGQGIQLKYGPHAGRLLQQFTIINSAGAFQAVSIYSDDHGSTWKSGTPVGTGMDENKTVELSDGRVMLNSRDSGRSGYRKVAYSTDGGITYGEVTIDRELPDPANNASIIRAFPDAPQGSAAAKVLLFSNASSQKDRTQGIIRASYDDGQTWPTHRVFAPGEMAYSTLATLPNGHIGLLYEPGHNGITFASFNMAWLCGLCASITTDEALTVERGTTATTSITVTNQLGPIIKGATMSATVPDGWTMTLSPIPTELQPHGTLTSTATITVPANATVGAHQIPITFTSADGRSSTGSLKVLAQKPESERAGRISVTGSHTNPKSPPYKVGDVLQFDYRVTNMTDAVTTVAPTGNLAGLDPANASRNCRWINLPGKDAYTCSSSSHTVTQADLDAGSFTPSTTWVSTSGEDVTTVKLDGPQVPLQ